MNLIAGLACPTLGSIRRAVCPSVLTPWAATGVAVPRRCDWTAKESMTASRMATLRPTVDTLGLLPPSVAIVLTASAPVRQDAAIVALGRYQVKANASPAHRRRRL